MYRTYGTYGSYGISRPIVGVYLGSGHMSIPEIKAHFRLRKLVEANRKAGTTLVFFTSDDVDLANRRFSGVYCDDRDNKWKRKTFPLPDVVYVRGGGGESSRLLEKFDELGIKRINPLPAFYKNELFEVLSQYRQLRKYLPTTVIINRWDEVRSTVKDFGKAYVKAHRGRRGLQVLRIEKAVNNKGYWYSYSILGKLVRRKARTLDHAVRSAKTFFGDKKIIVQKAIDLIKLSHNRLVDFRAEMQRNNKDEIEIVGICVRVGRPNSPITTHASAYRYEDYLAKLFPRYTPSQLKALKDEIQDFLYNIYLAVEREYGKFGEIGIDFGLDRRGRIWLIECNAQSAKVSIVKAYGSQANRIFLNPLEYAKTIARERYYAHIGGRSYGYW